MSHNTNIASPRDQYQSACSNLSVERHTNLANQFAFKNSPAGQPRRTAHRPVNNCPIARNY